MPVNMQESDRKLFAKEAHFCIEDFRVDELQNMFVTRSGMVMKNLKLLDESIHGYPEKRRGFYLYALYNYLRKPKLNLKGNKPYLLIHNHWCPGYYHWITEALPRLWLASQQYDDYTLLLPESYSGKYIEESLAPFNIPEIFRIPDTKNLKVENLLLPNNKSICATYDNTIVNGLRELYHTYIEEQDLDNFARGERIYISRKNAPRRKFQNEDAVEELVKSYGFEVIEFENISFYEQVSLLKHTKVLVSIHGAALTNLQFMQAGSKVLELHRSILTEKDHHSVVYWHLADALDVDYYYQFCEPVDASTDFFFVDLVVDLEALETNLKLITDAE